MLLHSFLTSISHETAKYELCARDRLDQMSSPPSDTDVSYSSLPTSSPFLGRGDVFSQSYRRPEPSRYGVTPGVQSQRTAVNSPSSFRQQPPPPPTTTTMTKYPHKEQLFVAISNESCTDGINDSSGQRSWSSSGSQRRVKFNDERPHVGSSDHHVHCDQRSGVIPPQQELRNNSL